MASYLLSKSTYIRGKQCLKSLYLNKHRPYLRDKISEEQLAKFARGHSVGKLAWELFPGGVELPRPGDSTAARTKELITSGVEIIYEACFIYDEVIIALDILVKKQDGWHAFEIKSSGELSDTYYKDARLQQYVIGGAGFILKSFQLVHRDLSVIIGEHDEVADLFRFTEVPPLTSEQITSISGDIDEMKTTLTLKQSPAVHPGVWCLNPYPCDFRGLCWKNLTEEVKQKILDPGSNTR